MKKSIILICLIIGLILSVLFAVINLTEEKPSLKNNTRNTFFHKINTNKEDSLIKVSDYERNALGSETGVNTIEIIYPGIDSSKAKAIRKLVENQEICKLAKKLRENSRSYVELPALIEHLRDYSSSKELVSILEIYFDNKSQGIETEKELFFYTTSLERSNSELSKKLFKKLQLMSPDNGAYYFFNLINLTSKIEILEEIELMAGSKYFDSHFKWLTRTLREETINDFNAFQLGLSIHSKIRYPNYLEAYQVIKKYQKNINNTSLLTRYIKTVLDTNLRSNGKFIDLYWIPMEYIIFKKMYYLLGNKKIKAYIEYKELMNYGVAGSRRKLRSSFVKKLNNNCDPSEAELFLDFEKKILNEFKMKNVLDKD